MGKIKTLKMFGYNTLKCFCLILTTRTFLKVPFQGCITFCVLWFNVYFLNLTEYKYTMSTIWFFMILASVSLLLFNNPSLVISEMLSASSQGFNLILNLCSIYAIWLGLLEILDKCGLSDKLAKALNPIIRFLFRSKNKTANKYIAINMASNMLGLGNASTPSGIKAMQELDDKSGKANFSMIMLLVVNSVSIQLLPTTIIGLRENAGSSNSSDIILPILISSFITCVFAISLVFLFSKIFKSKKEEHHE